LDEHPAGLAPFAYEWDRLATHAGAAPYLRPGWAEAWWRAFGSGERKLYVLRREGRLAGALPMQRHGDTLVSAANYHSPGFGLLTEDENVTAALARVMFADRPTRLSLTSLDPSGDSLETCRQAAVDAGYRVVIRPYQRALYIDIERSWHEYESDLGRNLLRNLRRARRHLEGKGQVRMETVHGGVDVEALLREAFAVEASGWKGLGRTAIESDPRTRGFYTDIGLWAAARGMLRLSFLRLSGRPLAMYFALVDRGVCHLLKGGYDPAYRRHSPGTLLMHAVIRECFTAGLSRIEFHGDAEPYKFCWAAAVRERKRLEAFAPTAAGRLSRVAFSYGRPLKNRALGLLGAAPDAGA
jgi:CelD/BcsL family acetyltransferase involved in cellulose biosynthesis